MIFVNKMFSLSDLKMILLMGPSVKSVLYIFRIQLQKKKSGVKNVRRVTHYPKFFFDRILVLRVMYMLQLIWIFSRAGKSDF